MLARTASEMLRRARYRDILIVLYIAREYGQFTPRSPPYRSAMPPLLYFPNNAHFCTPAARYGAQSAQFKQLYGVPRVVSQYFSYLLLFISPVEIDFDVESERVSLDVS